MATHPGVQLVLSGRMGRHHWSYIVAWAQVTAIRHSSLKSLRDHLAQRSVDTVTVEYNPFSDFGHERSYNVRSVDGVLLAEGRRVVKDAERFCGQMLTDGSRPPECW